MVIHKDLRNHQYLDDWLVRARSHQACLQHTQELVNNVSATRLAGELLSLPACPVREFRSVIGLLTATEKQVHVGQLHMRLIQWHHKHNWRVPESLEKVIPTHRSLHPHLQ